MSSLEDAKRVIKLLQESIEAGGYNTKDIIYIERLVNTLQQILEGGGWNDKWQNVALKLQKMVGRVVERDSQLAVTIKQIEMTGSFLNLPSLRRQREYIHELTRGMIASRQALVDLLNWAMTSGDQYIATEFNEAPMKPVIIGIISLIHTLVYMIRIFRIHVFASATTGKALEPPLLEMPTTDALNLWEIQHQGFPVEPILRTVLNTHMVYVWSGGVDYWPGHRYLILRNIVHDWTRNEFNEKDPRHKRNYLTEFLAEMHTMWKYVQFLKHKQEIYKWYEKVSDDVFTEDDWEMVEDRYENFLRQESSQIKRMYMRAVRWVGVYMAKKIIIRAKESDQPVPVKKYQYYLQPSIQHLYDLNYSMQKALVDLYEDENNEEVREQFAFLPYELKDEINQDIEYWTNLRGVIDDVPEELASAPPMISENAFHYKNYLLVLNVGMVLVWIGYEGDISHHLKQIIDLYGVMLDNHEMSGSQWNAIDAYFKKIKHMARIYREWKQKLIAKEDSFTLFE